jgi:hypothetical protein
MKRGRGEVIAEQRPEDFEEGGDNFVLHGARPTTVCSLFSPRGLRLGAESVFSVGRKGEFYGAYAASLGARVYRVDFKDGRVIINGEEMPPAEVETGRAINVWTYGQGNED